MDLRSMLNASDGAAAAAAQAKSQQMREPSTPVQAMPPQFRDYSQSTQASPRRSASHDFPPQQHTPGPAPYASPSSAYPPSAGGGPYGGRPGPPPQLVTGHDPRSPSIGAAPSPYRHTPTGSMSGVAGGYPFPNTGPPAPVSPVQRHQQYAPTGAYPPRDSYSQPPGASVAGATGQPAHPSYMQGPPQTPPVGTPGGPNPYLHQRSQSAQSTPTPTSAQSQHQYGPPYAQGSPVVSHHPPPHQQQQHSQPPQDQIRHPSQPPTPLGPPLSTQRPPSTPGGYAQPPSPYQQRIASTGSYPPHLATHPSPGPPPPPSVPRMVSSHSTYDPTAEAHRRSISQSERGRSVSISPKTRVSSLPSSTGHPVPDSDPRHARAMSGVEPDRDRAVTPAKRKMDDRDLRSDEIDPREPRPAPFQGINGSHVPSRSGPPAAISSPVAQRRRKIRYREPPVWARAFEHGAQLKKANYVVRKGGGHHPQVNGRSDGDREPSRQTSPEAGRTATSQPPPAKVTNPKLALLGGEWEECITGQKPYEEFTRRVADFLFLNVVANPNLREIMNRGVQFEIEAKLGMLVSKNTNGRFELPVTSECIIREDAEIAFRSSMSEAQHQAFNGFLNTVVQQTHPDNPENKGREKPRAQVRYKHSREKDCFFELPPALQDRLPGCVRGLFPTKHTPAVRVTYDQADGTVTAKIVKAKVANLHIHFPMWPLDCRLSVNLEMDWDGPVEELEAAVGQSARERKPDRNKDRLSYKQGHIQVDLTQVTHSARGPNNTERVEKEHELEIEINPQIVIEQGTRAQNGEEHAYQEVVEALVDNVRALARIAADFPY